MTAWLWRRRFPSFSAVGGKERRRDHPSHPPRHPAKGDRLIGILGAVASGPHRRKVVHLGGLEQIANCHIDPLTGSRLA
jgi:hypothetical protein